jgi:hypothetical protein
MVVTHSNTYWNGRLTETNYAGGSAGAAYAKTEPANTAALTSQNYPFNETQTFPVLEYDQEAVEAAGQPADVKQTFTKSATILPGKKAQYLQLDDWIDWIIAQKDNEGGLPATSWCEVYKDGQRLRAVYGCYMTQYTLSWDGAGWPKEEIEYNAYEVIDVVTGANFSTAKAWDTTAPSTHKSMVLTIDSVEYEVKSLSMPVTLKYVSPDNKQSSDYFHKFPYFEKFETWELAFEIYAYDSDHFLDLETVAADLFTITLAGFAAKTLTLNQMKVKKDTLNIKDVPEKGMKLYAGTFEIGGDLNPSTA